MRLTLRSLRQRVINRLNSISAVGLNVFGSGRFDVMPGTPARIVNRVKAQDLLVPESFKGELLRE